MTTSTIAPSKACSDFAAALRYEDIPADVVDMVKRDLLDWVGCATAGAASVASEPIKAVTAIIGGPAQATAVDHGKLDVVHAAMSNAYYGHIFEMDDVDRESISHPATVNMAPAMAVAEYAGKTGRDAITAIVAGFEVMLRIGAAITPEHYKIFHTTATTGVFGAAMAAGKLLDLGPVQMAWALGNAGTSAAGLWQFLPDGAMSKFLHTGSAAGNGVLVALLAQNGFSGASHILEGPQGFFAGYARQAVDETLFADFGKRWRTGTVSFKPYPCCRHTHSAIDAAAEIRRQAGGEKLASVKVYSYSTAQRVAGIRHPQTCRQAKFSVPWCVASTILRGIPSEADFADDSVKEADVQALEALIQVVIDDEIEARVPHNWPCRIEADTVGGRHLVAQVWDPTGDPENTLTWEGVETKFRILTDGIIDAAAQDRVISLCKNFENLGKPAEIFETVNGAFKRKY